MKLPAKFDATSIESKWYEYWIKHQFFYSKPDNRKPYSIVIPPPNVTGVLHMGHMLNVTLQDVLIRRARMRGYNACWVPGTDHASIATEAKVVQRLKEQGIEKKDLNRDEFLNHAWEWTHEHGGIILEQLKKLGCSCDWQRTKFTLDDDMTEAVIKVFVDLYNKGLIYRGYRMVNWDPVAQTTLSDEEVIHEERQGKLFYIAYQVASSDETITIATTRPETLFGDTAIAVHPDDDRYTHLHGKHIIVPLVGRKVPVITDTYIDMEFGTGCLKVTPAHDENDKNIGDKNKLEIIDVFHPDGTLNTHALHYEGKDRFVARKEIVKELEALGFLIKTDAHTHKVGTSERTKAVIEPRLSDQWFLKMKDIAKPAIDAIEKGEVTLFPSKFLNTYRHWMHSIRDWNISRQLWWGQQIPAYYYGTLKDEFVVAETREKALEKAIEKSNNLDLKMEDLSQDQDVLDTWFSSWLWPISVFDGIRFPENEEVNYYYPTQDLVTGPDILFFWVARMIISGHEFRNQKPFSNVYLTGLVRDNKGRKMSKQLGNSPNALTLISDFGADSVRVGLLLSSAAGNDLLFDEALCQQGKNFSNKIWNAFRLIQGWEIDSSAEIDQTAALGIQWYESKFQMALELIDDHFEKYRISDALMTIYKLVWDDFCSWFLEIIKPEYPKPIDRQTHLAVIRLFESNLRLLHPFMPFLTEELWHAIKNRQPQEALVVSKWPEQQSYDEEIITSFAHTVEVISGIRSIRKQKNIAFKESLKLITLDQQDVMSARKIVQKLGNISVWDEVQKAPEKALSFRVGVGQYYLPISLSDVGEELEKIEAELKYQKGFLKSVQKKLANERFVQNAPEAVVASERKKEADALAKILLLTQNIHDLRS